MALLNHRNIPRSEELGSPAQRLFSRRTRTNIHTSPGILQPSVIIDVPRKILESRQQQKKYFDKGSHQLQILKPGDKVRMIKNKKEWEFGTVVSAKKEPRSYNIRTSNGDVFRRNSRQLHLTKAKIKEKPKTITIAEPNQETEDERESRDVIESQDGPNTSSRREAEAKTTRSGRIVRPPDRLDL